MAAPDQGRRARLVALGDSIRRRRLELGLSQEQVALSAGVSIRTYRSIEMAESASGGELNPRLATLLIVLDVLGLPLSVVDEPDSDDRRG